MSKECAKVWKEAQQLPEANAITAGTDVRPGLFTESGFLKVDIAAVAKACRSCGLARR